MSYKSVKIIIEDWCIHQSIKRPIPTIVISIAFTILISMGIQFIVVDDDMMKMLPSNIESKKSWDDIQNDFGSTEIIFVAFGHKDSSVYKSKIMSDLWMLTDRLGQSPYIEKISNISTATAINQVDGFIDIDDLQPTKDISSQQLENIKVYLNRNLNLKKQLISKGEDYVINIVTPTAGTSLDIFRDEVVFLSDSILTGYDIHFGGTAYITGSIPNLVREDIGILVTSGLIMMLIILLTNLRSLQGVSLIFITIFFSLSAMLGFMGWAYKITGSNKFLFALLNTSMPIILLTIANSDGVHVITKFFRELRYLGEVDLAIESAMRSLLFPISLTSITTIVAFLTMITAPLEPLIGYGLCMAVGILWAWLLSSFMLPAIIVLLRWDQNSEAISQPGYLEKFLNNIAVVVFKYPKQVFSIGTLTIMLGAFGLSKIDVDVNVSSFFEKGTEIRKSMDFMDSDMSGTMDLRILVDGDIRDPSILNQMDSLQNFINQTENVNVTYSIVDVLKQIHRVFMDDDEDYEKIPDQSQKVNNLLTMYTMSGGSDELSKLADNSYRSALITSLSSTMSTNEVFSYVKSITAYINNHFSEKTKVKVTGMIVIIRDMVDMVIRSSLLSIITSMIFVGVITSLFYGRMIWGLLAVLPLFAAIILNFGLMGYFGVKLNHVTAILSAIIIGVGVDFAIHFISRFQKISCTSDKVQTGEDVIKDVGYPIILDAGSNMAFGALLFSSFIPVQHVGGLMVFSMLSTSLGTLILLTSAIELLKISDIIKDD